MIDNSPLSMHVCAKLEEDAIKVSDDLKVQQEFLEVIIHYMICDDGMLLYQCDE